jgi:murein DD-endopeptidase / murein LD-carboxypeptidase
MQAQREAIARRALAEVGTPYRLHGRIAGVSLDCVGLVAIALGEHMKGCAMPTGYALRGNHLSDIEAFIDQLQLLKLGSESNWQAGDIIATAPSPRQTHLAICAGNGWVHAHAGLRRVVHSPALDDPIIRGWRLIGD